MAVYGYKGVNASGRGVKGVKDAGSARELKTVLKAEGVYLTDLQELDATGQSKEEAAGGGIRIELTGRVTSQDISMATRQLATLAHAGIPLVEALGALTEQLDKPALKTTYTQVRDRISEGQSFSEALGAFPRYFSKIYVNMINAGEQSGTLELVLARLADFMEGQERLKNKLIAAMAYPVIMAAIGSLILWIMMVVVVPKVTAIFEDFGQTLPWYTRTLMGLSDMLRSWVFWLVIVPLVVGGVVMFIRWKRTTDGREKWHAFVLRLPVFGELIMMIAMSRFAKTLGTLLSSGVPVLKALEITRHVLGNAILENVVDEAIVSVREGEHLFKPLQDSGRFPPMVSKMIAIGEQSGQLEDMLENVAVFYNEQADTRISIMTSILEPVMILIMGGGAATVTACILMPLLKIHQFAG
ncbi:MAG: type II secretion system inner membrane protein GspF [Deltaproteobacteria bacterium]|nr:type II secretion system inner membrane protein GspF [Deltaproteobacteria bacterium]